MRNGAFGRATGGGGTAPAAPSTASPAAAASHGGNTVSPPPRALGTDPIDRLPAEAARKLRELRSVQEEVAERSYSLATARHGAVDRLRRATDYRDRILRAPIGGNRQRVQSADRFSNLSGGYHAGDAIGDVHYDNPAARDKQLVQAEAEVQAVRDELAELDGKISALAARRSAVAQRCTEWLGALATGTVLEFHPPPEPPKPNGKTSPIEAIRQRIARQRAELEAARTAPFPSGVCKRLAREQIEALAERGTPSVLPLVEHGRSIAFPKADTRGQLFGHVASPDHPQITGFSAHDAPDSLAVLAWLFRNEMVSRIEAEIDEFADDENALDDSQRAAKSVDLLAEILECERVEEAIIEAAAASGQVIARRDDADPRAVLGVQLQ